VIEKSPFASYSRHIILQKSPEIFDRESCFWLILAIVTVLLSDRYDLLVDMNHILGATLTDRVVSIISQIVRFCATLGTAGLQIFP